MANCIKNNNTNTKDSCGSWGSVPKFLEAMAEEKEATLVVKRSGSDHNPNLNPPAEYSPPKTLFMHLKILINFVKLFTKSS